LFFRSKRWTLPRNNNHGRRGLSFARTMTDPVAKQKVLDTVSGHP
jgi:hypothetical protein